MSEAQPQCPRVRLNPPVCSDHNGTREKNDEHTSREDKLDESAIPAVSRTQRKQVRRLGDAADG